MNARAFVYRDAAQQDAEALGNLGRQTFLDTFGHLYPPQEAAAFCDAIYNTDAQRAVLSHEGVEVRLAAQGATMAGYCQIGPFKLPFESGGRRALELHRLYVIAELKGAGVGAALMDWALMRMRQRGAEDAYLGVYQDNLRAQRFYARYGFEVVGAYKFPVGSTLDDEFIMRARLAT